METATATVAPAPVLFDPMPEADPAPGPDPALLAVPELIVAIAAQSRRPLGDTLLLLLRTLLSVIIDPPEGPTGPRPPATFPQLLMESMRTSRRLSARLQNGAVLRFDRDSGGFVLVDRNGVEAARAARVGELGLLLDALDGRSVKKRGVVVKAGPFANRAAAVRQPGESLTALYHKGLLKLIEEREAEIAADGRSLDAADPDGPGDDDGDDDIDIARDGLGLMAMGVH